MEFATSLSQFPTAGIPALLEANGRELGRGLAAPDKLSAPKALRFISTADAFVPMIAVVGAAAAAALAVLLIRHIMTKRALSTRVEYELLPSSAFDPSAEEVQRFARQLTRTRPAEARMRPRRGTSVRIAMKTSDDGKLQFSMSGPRNASSVLRHPTYSQVEIREYPPRD